MRNYSMVDRNDHLTDEMFVHCRDAVYINVCRLRCYICHLEMVCQYRSKKERRLTSHEPLALLLVWHLLDPESSVGTSHPLA